MKNLNEKLSQALEIEPLQISPIEDKPELSTGTDIVEVKDVVENDAEYQVQWESEPVALG